MIRVSGASSKRVARRTSPRKIVADRYPVTCCRLDSATPRSASDITNPARNLYAAKSPTSCARLAGRCTSRATSRPSIRLGAARRASRRFGRWDPRRSQPPRAVHEAHPRDTGRGTQLPDRDFAAGTELIGLRAPQLDDGPALFEATIGNVERGNFRPSKCTGNGEEKKCAICGLRRPCRKIFHRGVHFKVMPIRGVYAARRR